jgi:hypothetical protein
MMLRVKKFIDRRPDDSGDFFSVWFDSGTEAPVQLEMTMAQGNALMAQIAQCGLVAAGMRGDPIAPPDGEEPWLTNRATMIDASFGPDGNPMVGCRFGRTRLGVRLTTEQARLLAQQLSQLVASS